MRRDAAILVLGLLATLGGASAVLAEPAFAVRTGYRCSQCHVNRSGGGMRTAFGSVYTQTVLPRNLIRWREEGNLLPADPEARFAVGADIRARYLHVRSDDAEDTSTFEVNEANVYGEARLLPGRLSLYLDERVGPGGASARELFALVSFGKWNGYVKAGKFLPAYGWRLPDDDAYVRQFTGFTYSAPDTGVEVGFEPGRYSFHFGALNGAASDVDDNRSKKFVLAASRRYGPGRIGVSGANDIGGSARTSRVGVFGGVNLGRLALLGEADWLETRADTTTNGAVALFEADLLVSRGVNLKYAHDWRDPDLDLDTDERTRDSLGLEFIPWPFVQLRAYVRIEDGPPQLPGTDDEQFELELHVFF